MEDIEINVTKGRRLTKLSEKAKKVWSCSEKKKYCTNRGDHVFI